MNDLQTGRPDPVGELCSLLVILLSIQSSGNTSSGFLSNNGEDPLGLKTLAEILLASYAPSELGALCEELQERLSSEQSGVPNYPTVSEPVGPTADIDAVDTDPETVVTQTGVGGEPVLPKWNKETMELTFAGKLCKKLVPTATAQICLLDAFQEDGWPERIDDPLPGKGYIDPHQRLGDTIRRLNSCAFLRFERDGTGVGIRWKLKN